MNISNDVFQYCIKPFLIPTDETINEKRQQWITRVATKILCKLKSCFFLGDDIYRLYTDNIYRYVMLINSSHNNNCVFYFRIYLDDRKEFDINNKFLLLCETYDCVSLEKKKIKKMIHHVVNTIQRMKQSRQCERYNIFKYKLSTSISNLIWERRNEHYIYDDT
jgi:hypothetical protein